MANQSAFRWLWVGPLALGAGACVLAAMSQAGQGVDGAGQTGGVVAALFLMTLVALSVVGTWRASTLFDLLGREARVVARWMGTEWSSTRDHIIQRIQSVRGALLSLEAGESSPDYRSALERASGLPRFDGYDLLGAPELPRDANLPQYLLDQIGQRWVAGDEKPSAHEIEAGLRGVTDARLVGLDTLGRVAAGLGFLGSLAGVAVQAWQAASLDGQSVFSGSFMAGTLLAMTTSLQGLLTASWIGLLRQRLERPMDALTARAVSYGRHALLPRLDSDTRVEEAARAAVQEAVDICRTEVAELIKGVNRECAGLIDRVNRECAAMLSAVNEQNQTAIERQRGEVSTLLEGSRAAMQAAVDAVTRHLTDELRGAVASAVAEPGRAVLADMRQSFTALRTTMEAIGSQLASATASIQTSVDLLDGDLRAFLAAPNHATALVREASGEMHRQTDRFRALRQDVERSIDRLETVAGTQISRAARALEDVEDRQLNQVFAHVGDTVERLRGTLEQAESLVRAQEQSAARPHAGLGPT